MVKKKVIGTLRRLTRIAQKRAEKEAIAQKNLAALAAKERARKEKIWESKDLEANANLLIGEVLAQAKETAKRGYYTDSFNFFRDFRIEGNGEEIKKLVIDKLRKLGFAAEFTCGHGHGSHTKKGWNPNVINCDGTTYDSCWPELCISWGAESAGWKGRRKK